MPVTTLSDDVETLADAFFRGLEEGSVERVLACYAPDARIWHNFDRIWLTPEESVAGLRQLFDNFDRRRYVDVKRLPTPPGFVQQHVLELVTPGGATIEWPGCIVIEITDGRISLLEEYVDIASLTGEG